MTPGAYLRECREALGLSVDDVALRLDSTPPVSHRSRAELLAQIEADQVPVSLSSAVALADAVRTIGLRELAELVDRRADRPRLSSAGGDAGPAAPMLLNQGGEAAA